ncbi:MAG TPA: hypothetical protein VJ964_10960 [Balneolaceae bacterium]|nr:hypothetical protein [Balneolaceae bacterium]
MSSIEKRLKNLESAFGSTMHPIQEWAPGLNKNYLGCPMDTKVDIQTLLTLQNNAILHEYHRIRPADDSWKEKLVPTSIPQQWEDFQLEAEP